MPHWKCVQSPPEEQGPCLCKSDKVTTETREWRLLGSQGNTNRVKTQKFSFIHYSLSEEELQQAQRFSASLKNSSLSQAFVPSILQCLNVSVLSEIMIPALP